MWRLLLLLAIANAASAEHNQAWKTDTEYQYSVRGRTLAALHEVSDQYTGIILKALLTVQPKSKDTLEAKLSRSQYAQIHTKLPGGWKSEIPESQLDLKQLPMTEKVFEVKMQEGVVRDLIVDKDVPTWEVNLIKSIVSQLQVDMQGKNIIPSRYNQELEGNHVSAMFKTMEDSVGGRCEVMYDISPLPEHLRSPYNHDSSMKEEDHDNSESIEIVKTRNYTNCEQRMSYHFGESGPSGWEQVNNGNGQFMSRSSISRIIVTGNSKSFTIRSSVTADNVILSPNFNDNQKGMVSSKVNVTLVKMGPASSGSWSTPANPESTGTLVYNYNNPFAKSNEERRSGQSNCNQSKAGSKKDWRYNKNKSEEDDDSSASKSSGSVDSMECNEEQQAPWQRKPTLNDAPDTPLLPLSIGYHGKSVQKSADMESVSTATRLASQIGRDLQNPNTITEEQTLEKFTILSSVIRTMSTQQIAEAQREIYQSANQIDPHDSSQSVRRGTWTAFRDAIAQAGTGPALVTIKNWIKEKKVKGIEAATLVSVLSKTARTPTPEYMNAFFEMATMPETTSQQFLDSSAIVTFAELVRLSQVNHQTAHDRYPVHSFGRLSPKHNSAIFTEYVPYMAKKMQEAIDNKEAAKAHVYIRALGELAHPKILAVFEPYLEGKKPASTLQRMMMVFSMNKLATLRPRLASGVLYRIYQSTTEAHQIRCAAVSLLIATDPPASMLQRMAEFTNYDHSKQVNAAVKSAIESASELTRPEAQDLATKARNVKHLLNKENYGFEFSKNYFIDYVEKEMNIAYRGQAAHIGSEDSFIPQAIYAKLQSFYGSVKGPKAELGAMVSSVKDLINSINQHLDDDQNSGNKQQDKNEWSPEKVAKMLDIKMEHSESLEGAVLMNSEFANKFFSFDKHSLQRIPELMSKVYDSLKNGDSSSMVKFVSNDVTLSFPMESGLPFVFSFKTPMLVKLSGSAKAHNNAGSVDVSADLRVVYAAQTQSKLGFVTPFEHQNYLAGVNKNYQIYLPIQAKVNYEKSENRATLKLEPIDKSEEIRIMEWSIIPFTSRHNILSMSPVTKDKETQELKHPETLWSYKDTMRVGPGGMKLKLMKEKDTRDPFSSEDILFETQNKIELRRSSATLVPGEAATKPLTISVAYETLEDHTMKQAPARNAKELKAKAPQIHNKEMNNSERRKHLLKEVVKGIAAAEAMAVDVGIDLPGQEEVQIVLSLAYADSKIDEKSRGLMYAGINGAMVSSDTCAAVETLSPTISAFDMKMADKSPARTSRYMDMELRECSTSESGPKIRITGKQEQSERLREFLKELPSMIQCMKDAKKGKTSSAACQDASVKLSTMDEAQIEVKVDDQTRDAEDMIDSMMEMLSDKIDRAVKRSSRNDGDRNSIKFNMQLEPSTNHADFSYESNRNVINITDVDIGSFATLATNADPALEASQSLNMDLDDENAREYTCVVDSKTATTFDQSSYPVNLGKCWHVAVTTYPKSDENSHSKSRISEDMKFNVLVRDADNENKEAKIALGNAEITLKSSGDKNHASINGKPIEIQENSSYKQKNEDGENEMEVLKRPDGSIRVVSDKYEVDLIYYGKRIQIQASDKYRNDVRGLCGNYDGQPRNDFTTPNNCVLTRADQFAASYALTSKDCQGPAQTLSKEAKEAVCHHMNVRPGNVVNDHEAGRSKSSKNSRSSDDSKENHEDRKRCTMVRTKVIEDNDEMCFSLRPLPACAPGCNSSRSKPKFMPMYCVPKDSAASKMAERIKQGANPDLSQKTMSKKLSFYIPVSCHAA